MALRDAEVNRAMALPDRRGKLLTFRPEMHNNPPGETSMRASGFLMILAASIAGDAAVAAQAYPARPSDSSAHERSIGA